MPLIKSPLFFGSLERQTKILLLLIGIGFGLISIIGLIALNGLKYEYDTNINTRLDNAKSLQDIQKFYTYLIVHNAKESKTQYENIKTQYEKLLQKWHNYETNTEKNTLLYALKSLYQNLFFTKSIIQMQDKITQRNKLNNELSNLIANTKNILTDQRNKKTQTNQALLTHSIEVSNKISEIFEKNTEIFSLQDSITDSIYATTMIFLLIFMLFVSIVTVYSSSVFIGFMRGKNTRLEKIISQKTNELKNTNENLQKTIEYQIEQSRKKDQIMYQQARLASMGEMIQNIAHQWRQPLNSLIILIQNFKLKYENGTLSDEFVEMQTKNALKIANNMSDTIENFRNFFQPHIKKKHFFICESIKDSIALIKPTLEQNNIQILFEYNEDIEIFGYENAFSQIILNIIKNSQDALTQCALNVDSSLKSTQDSATNNFEAQGGIIQITLSRNTNCPLPQNANNADDKIECVEICIMDNGGGIKIAQIDKIFEPYFTTKHKSIGTGIGLYMVKQIVEKQMSGYIEVNNTAWIAQNLNKECYGANFMIRFPLNFSKQVQNI